MSTTDKNQIARAWLYNALARLELEPVDEGTVTEKGNTWVVKLTFREAQP